MKLWIFTITLFLYYATHAQQKVIDSLTLELKKHKTPNEDRLNILNELGYYYSATDADKGLEITDDAIDLATALDRTDKLAYAYRNKGNIYSVKAQYLLAHINMDKAIDIETRRNNQIALGKSIFNKGLIYFGQSNYKKANECNLKAYDIFEMKDDSLLMAKMLNSIGINLMYQSKYPEAIDAYLRASSIYEDLNLLQSPDYANILNNTGLLYNRVENFNEAILSINKALEIYKTLDLQKLAADGYTNLGNSYDNLNQPQKAIEHYQKAYTIMEQIGNKTAMANAMTNTGIAYTSLGNYSKSLEYLNKTKVIYKEIGNINNLGLVHQNIGLNYLKKYDINKNDTSLLFRAKENFKKAKNYLKQVGNINSQANSLEYLTSVYVKLEDYKDAYETKLEAVKMKDSFYSYQKREELVKIEEKYKYEQKELSLLALHNKERAIAEAEISHQKMIRNISLLGGGLLLTAIITSVILYKRRQDLILQKKESDFNTTVAETELKVLRAQMNPHFIFNSLNSIGDYILKNDTHSAVNYLTKFAKLMRLTLEQSTEKEILLNDDIVLTKMYLDIENKRFNNRFTYEVHIDSKIDINNTLVPPLILQPFIENSIIHGFTDKKENGHIEIAITKNKDMLLCSVDDNGIGRQNTNKNKKAYGVKITQRRIDIINRVKDSKGDIKVIDKDTGVKVVVSFPLELAL